MPSYEPKKSYRAVFADGSIATRKSDRTYLVAWRWQATRVSDGEQCKQGGFARDRQAAVKAASAVIPAGDFNFWRDIKTEIVPATQDTKR